MNRIEDHIRESILHAVKKAGWDPSLLPEFGITASKQKDHGDFATNVALVSSCTLKKNPREIAQTLAVILKEDDPWIGNVQVAGPGFLNFTLKPAYLYEVLKSILELGSAYGKSDWGGGKRTQVEFVSANPTGPLTIGHGRQAVIGDVIARLLSATGHAVTREYYFNDAGRQMRVLGDSVRLRYLGLLGKDTEFPEDYYRGEYIRDIAGKALKEKGDGLGGEQDIPYFSELAEKVVFEDIRKTLERLGIRFDIYYNEKSLYESGRVDAVIQALRSRDLAYDMDGAVWFRTTKFGHEQDRVIVKSTGEPTYRLPDIAYHVDKINRGFELIVDIFGADHIATYPDVLAGLEGLGYDKSRVRVLIHQFVTLMEGNEKVKMSTRKANFVTLDELMDEVGEDVTRYFFINRSMNSHLNFDLTIAKTQSDENPVYYVQYAHARISSVLHHAEKEGYDPEAEADLTLLSAPEEMDLARVLLAFPETVTSSARDFEPQRIPAYLEEIATAYHRFQHSGKMDSSLRVVTDNRPVTQARLALCRAARIVLANGLDLLGISKPERM